MRIVANALARLILLVTLSYSMLLADEMNTVAVWDFGVRDIAVLFGVGPLATLALLMVDWRGRYRRIPTSALLCFNGAGLLLLALLSFQTVSNAHGLWIEETIFENHFCNCLLRYHFFPPYVGWTGMYLSVVGYVSYKKLSWLMFTVPATLLTRFIGFVPIAGFYGLVVWHQWIPKPYFMG
ncbi:MAG: hypothetical protein AAFU71_05075 [Cyanobacteria bacterium J06632_22]